MKPVVWRIFRNGRWNYADKPSNGFEDKAAWQPLYTRDDELRQQAASLALELQGVIADVEQGTGIDAVCVATIRRVMESLQGMTLDLNRRGA